MKRLFLLGVVATVIFSMAACNNDDMSVDINAHRPEAPRDVTVSVRDNMAIVSWIAGANASTDPTGGYDIVRRIDGTNTILDVTPIQTAYGGTFEWTNPTGNTRDFRRATTGDRPIDRRSAVILLPFSLYDGQYRIGVRASAPLSVASGASAPSDIEWARDAAGIVSFGAASAFRAVTNISISPVSITGADPLSDTHNLSSIQWSTANVITIPNLTYTRDGGTFATVELWVTTNSTNLTEPALLNPQGGNAYRLDGLTIPTAQLPIVPGGDMTLDIYAVVQRGTSNQAAFIRAQPVATVNVWRAN